MENIVKLRQHIHANPELSGLERNTSNRVIEALNNLGITTIYQGFSMYSLIAEINGKESGSTILFRCELDALPIHEANDLPYRSIYEGISHKCGHDGHLAIMLRFAQNLIENPISKGKILLFFQSAEETGAGARGAIESGIFDQFSIDYAFALHNMPSFPMGAILAKEHLFTPCVESGIFELFGKTSHASEPQKGINPALAIAEIITYFDTLIVANKSSESYFLCTPIHINMGEKAYGTSAGNATVGYTFRTWENEKFDIMKGQIVHSITQIVKKYDLGLTTKWIETFNANTNHPEAFQQIKNAAQLLNLELIELEKPFEFGEDFGLFTKKYKGAMFGIGSGENQPPLHNAYFDFPDELIEIGSSMFFKISQQLL
jgi:amidohydrolase